MMFEFNVPTELATDTSVDSGTSHKPTLLDVVETTEGNQRLFRSTALGADYALMSTATLAI